MKLEDQVPSLELCQKLKELGYTQEGLWWWVLNYTNHQHFNADTMKWTLLYDPAKIDQKEEAEKYYTGDIIKLAERYVAPTVAEMGEVLPRKVDKHEWRHHLYILKLDDKLWRVYYENNECIIKAMVAHTLADSMAKMLIYLYENKLI